MLNISEARTLDVRALTVAVALGSSVGLAIGGAYLAGRVARVTVSPATTALSGPGARSPIVSALGVALRAHISPAADAARDDAAQGLRGRERQCLAQAVYYEARGESPDGQAAVAQVVMNRVRLPAFPKTVCGVVFQRAGAACQFSFACNGAMREAIDDDAWKRAQKVAAHALAGAVNPALRRATVFQAADAHMDSALARGLDKVAQIGAHVFYRLSGRDDAAAPPAVKVASDDTRVQVAFASFLPVPAPTPAPAPSPALAQNAPPLAAAPKPDAPSPASPDPVVAHAS